MEAENFQNYTLGEIYPNYSLEWEISNFIKVWIAVATSLSYCKFTSKLVPKGLPRLLTFFPVFCLFLYLPLNLHSMHLCGTTSFFIAWLSNFKILLLAFNEGPLSDPSLSLPQFLAVGCFPIKIQPNPPPKSQTKQNPSLQNPQNGHKSLWNYAIKVILVVAFVRTYNYSEHIHPKVILVIYCFHIYFMLEIMFAMVAALARATVGSKLEPQFDEPYLSTSLQDFWGRRWNIMVTSILRPTVYSPALRVWTRALGRKWAPLPATFVTFMVSAVMHELIFYYLGRQQPTGKITGFFILHGVCLVVEIGLKKVLKGRCRLPPAVSRPLTIGFVVVTGFWLFLPELRRCKGFVRAFDEYMLVAAFVKDIVGGAVKFRNDNGMGK
ncbi:hypothetical protein RHSIM_Rhsim13G0145700 [Rhododendron simsii]|uniref:Wax synthase domain-containing protein n=1 Tax=Rhododendron simsii TaxID=118357 RepID=A0A834G097_RHOSS|nr:hypothetical protein RHSIM_Rhsim13G0145700 [Rhododendron simsii]